jgi:putative transposase
LRYAFIQSHRTTWPIHVMSDVLEVARSGYYVWSKRGASPASQRRLSLTQAIRKIHDSRRGVYGSPRMHQELLAEGHRCCENLVAKLMRAEGIRAKTKRKFKATTNSNHRLPVAENVLNREFSRPTGRNQVWLGDITYIDAAKH